MFFLAFLQFQCDWGFTRKPAPGTRFRPWAQFQLHTPMQQLFPTPPSGWLCDALGREVSSSSPQGIKLKCFCLLPSGFIWAGYSKGWVVCGRRGTLLAFGHSAKMPVWDPTDDLVSVQAAKLLHLMFSLTDTLFPKRFSLRLHGSFDVVLAAMAGAKLIIKGKWKNERTVEM